MFIWLRKLGLSNGGTNEWISGSVLFAVMFMTRSWEILSVEYFLEHPLKACL